MPRTKMGSVSDFFGHDAQFDVKTGKVVENHITGKDIVDEPVLVFGFASSIAECNLFSPKFQALGFLSSKILI